MTSLSNQLESLRTATARQLTIEKKHKSLLFDKKEAQKLDRETVYKIGCTGLGQLRKLDSAFEDVGEFFEETAMNFQRSMITKEENEALSKKLEVLLFKLSPFMQHFACQQVLEWLIFKYQIYAYEAEFLMLVFLPFHETNLYGRLLSLIEFNFSTSKDWAFLEGFAKKEQPVPTKTLVKNALSSTHSLLTRISNHIGNGIELVGEEFLESKASVLFTFYAKLVLLVLENAKNVDDALLSKIVPLVANGIKSPLLSFRLASLMIICQLAVVVKLAPAVVSSINKVLIMKLKTNSLSMSISTLAVMCQHQQVGEFSTKATLKVLRRESSSEVWQCIRVLSEQTDLLPLLKPLWTTLIGIIQQESTSDSDRASALTGLVETAYPELLNKEQALEYMGMIVDAFSQGMPASEELKSNLYPIAVRFADEWEKIVTEWTTRDVKMLHSFLKAFDLNKLLMVQAQNNAKTKRARRRSNSLRKSVTEEAAKKKSAAEKAAEMAAASEFAKREKFSGDPIKKASEWMKKEQWDKVLWALLEMSTRRDYLKGQLDEDIEDFVLELISTSISHPKQLPSAEVKSAVAQAKLGEEIVVGLLTRHEPAGSAAKKAKTSKNIQLVAKVFENETAEQFERRLALVLEILHMSQNTPVSANLFKILYEIIKDVDAAPSGNQSYFIQRLAIGVVIKMMNNPGTYKVTTSDLQMECVVEMMRNTHSHHVLRDALRLLTAAVRLNPGSVTCHVMSVFTFMGSGLLRKDNEMTLSIIEQTLEALFVAVLAEGGGKTGKKEDVTARLIAVSRVFAASACDIPAHRRTRMAGAISRAIGAENIWLVASVLLEGFCAKWQRSVADASKKAADQDAFEDIALELCSNLEPVDQLRSVLDLIQFAIRLGGDSTGKDTSTAVDRSVFDRNKYSLPKLRHFRFVIVGIVVKVLSNRHLYAKLSQFNDEELYEQMLSVGKRLMTSSVELDEFINKEGEIANRSEDPQTMRYWVAVQGRAETVAEKLRHLLPGGVSARIISDVLEDEKTEWRMREKALQLANLKLMQDGFFSTDSGINEEHLNRLASILNKWIAPVRSDQNKVLLCQSAAFSLKLVAKRIPMQSQSIILTQTMEKCTETASKWKTLDECMVGNVLLLAGELIRSHNMRSTMLSAVPLLNVCLDILAEAISNQSQRAVSEESRPVENKRERVRQQSLCGRKLGTDTLLICALTCVQRILDQFAAFVSVQLGQVLVRYCRLSGRFSDMEPVALPSTPSVPPTSRGNIQHRLSLIRAALLRVELRVLPQHLAFAVEQLASEEKALCSLFDLLGGYFTMENRPTVQLRIQLVKDVFLKALDYRTIERKPESFENVCHVEQSVFSAFLRMADVLTEIDLRPLIQAIVQWAEPAMTSSADRNTRIRLIPLFHFSNQFYSTFNSLALPYFGKLIEMAPKVLRRCNATTVTDATLLLLTGKKDTVEGLETDYLIRNVIDFANNCARHREFLTSDRSDPLIDPLVDELVNTRVAGHESRCVAHLAEVLYRISDVSPDSFPDILNKVMLKTRNNRPKIRFRALLVVEELVSRIGDGIAPHLPMIMPFLSELLEDENRNVEEQCDRVVRLLQSKFGENIAEGFA